LTGGLQVTIGTAVSDHSVSIDTGSAATSITDDTSLDTVSVDASALVANTNLTLAGSAKEVVTNLIGDVSASGLTGAVTVTAAQNNPDHNISILTGSGITTITDNSSSDTMNVTVSGSDTVVMSGGANFVVNSGDGANTMTGGSGPNTYVYSEVADSIPTAPDTITNFHPATDKIDFSAISGLDSNAQPVTVSFLTSTPMNINAHTIDVVTVSGSTTIYADATNKSEKITPMGHEDMKIGLTGVNLTSANSSDFILHH
jgi:hypothetical protein